MGSLGSVSAAGIALAIATASERSSAAQGGRLLVFLHVAVKQRALQSALQESLAGIAVTAVGRIGDMERGIQEGQDAVLSLPVVFAAKGLSARLQGWRDSAADETYVLVGVNTPPDVAKIKTVGALDLLGRDGTTAFVNRLLGTQPKIERVTKVEDLLPLLQMEVVESVLMASRFLADVRSTSRLALASTELANRVALPAVASIGPAGDQVLASVSGMPAGVMTILGVDRWR
jgi:hypothetical protein